MKTKNYLVFKKNNNIYIDFENKVYKMDIEKTKIILSKISQKEIFIESEEFISEIFKKYCLFDEVFLNYISC